MWTVKFILDANTGELTVFQYNQVANPDAACVWSQPLTVTKGSNCP